MIAVPSASIQPVRIEIWRITAFLISRRVEGRDPGLVPGSPDLRARLGHRSGRYVMPDATTRGTG